MPTVLCLQSLLPVEQPICCPYTSLVGRLTNLSRLSMHFASFATGSATDACASERKYFPAFLSLSRGILSLSLFLRSVEKERKKKSRSKFRKVWILVGYLLVIIVITVDDYIVSGITVSFINYISCL